ncbi:hypothetical protein HYFRA_00008053 [Hymenoscyphus fraxineus]|uniref:Protein required for cell viability n=1 Tax=Hymenoscyphus fraxineus TaxID=746836 RepID=A0A9N9KQP5_9HELO|nr:hypothetical protein HYFRA_00008053 [Hymenoscyphus fraxineus]
MEGASKQDLPPLADSILELGKLAFDPQESENSRRESQPRFKQLIDGTSTLKLLPVLNHLVQPGGRAEPWLRPALISALARIPLRPRGVQDTIEFVLFVHPSSRARPSDGVEKRSGISHEALNAASRLLSSPPAGIASEEWFADLAPQLISLLQGEGEPEMDKAAAFIIGFGILGRKQYGAPGKPGWNAFVEPLYQCIDPALGRKLSLNDQEDDIITIGAPKILVPSDKVSKSLRNLSTLLTSHPHPSLAKRLLRPILLPLWALSSWSGDNEVMRTTFCNPATKLLKILVQLSASGQGGANKDSPISSPIFDPILQDLLFKGKSNPAEIVWEYGTSKDGGIQIQQPSGTGQNVGPNLELIDTAADKFVAFISRLENTPDFQGEISHLFMGLCTKWLSTTGSMKKKQQTIITQRKPDEVEHDFERRIIEAKVMQKMMSTFPGKLISNPRQVLDLVNQVLSDFVTESRDDVNGEDAASVALSLLNIVLTSTSFKIPPEDPALGAIQSHLQVISRLKHQDMSTTAQNLLLLLKYRGTIDEPETETTTKPTDQQVEDRKTYALALSYLTTTDSPPPVRVQGLELLSGLIKSSSSILDIPALLILFSSLLQDSEEYIYLRAIKSFIQLSQKHPKAVMKDLIDRYVDPNEDCDLDQRLRLGEALLQAIQSNPSTFTGDTARTVLEGLLFLAGRRGYRPKSEQEQQRRAKLKRKQDAEAEEAWDGEVPQLDEVLEEESSKEDEILAQILSGWESKRGSEDLRIRASAIAIIGSALGVSIAGIHAGTISTAIDLSIHILTLETGPEQAIVRRSAIVLVMSFVKALDTAREEGTKLPFGFVGSNLEDVERILGYVAETDGDGLVRRHAADVGESMKAWRMNELIPKDRSVRESGIGELRGLSITPGGELRDKEGRVRPRIEEVE